MSGQNEQNRTFELSKEQLVMSCILNYGPIGRRSLKKLTNISDRKLREIISKLKDDELIYKVSNQIGYDVIQDIRRKYDHKLVSDQTSIYILNSISELARLNKPLPITEMQRILNEFNLFLSLSEIHARICALIRQNLVNKNGVIFELTRKGKNYVRKYPFTYSNFPLNKLLNSEHTLIKLEEFLETDIPIQIEMNKKGRSILLRDLILSNSLQENILSIGKDKKINFLNISIPFNLETDGGFTLAGAIYGDGYFGLVEVPNKRKNKIYKRFMFEYNSTSKENLNNVINALKTVFGYHAQFRKKRELYSGNIYYGFTTRNTVVGFSLALAGFPIGDKTVLNPNLPKFVMRGKKKNKREFLRQFSSDEVYCFKKEEAGPYLSYSLVVDIDEQLKNQQVKNKLIGIMEKIGRLREERLYVTFHKIPDTIQEICLQNRSNIMKDVNKLFNEFKIKMKMSKVPPVIYLGLKTKRFKLIDFSHCYSSYDTFRFYRKIGFVDTRKQAILSRLLADNWQ